jgi:hypothetical protein
MQFSQKERNYIMQRFIVFKDQSTRSKIAKLAGFMGMEADTDNQSDMMYATIAYYMKHPEIIDSDLKSYSSITPDVEEGRGRPSSEVRKRQNRRKGEG